MAKKEKPSGLAGLIISGMGAPGEEEETDDEPMTDMEACCAEMILAFEKRDPKMLEKAFKACFLMCEAEPHEEGEAVNKRDMEKPLIGGYIDESEL